MRRSFLRKITLGSVALSLFSYPQKVQAVNEPIENALLHHVYFWLYNPESIDDRKQFEAAIQKLIQVETIQQSHIGVPASTENRDVVDHTYSYSLMLVFASKEDQDIYQIHPLHKMFVEANSHLWNKVIVYDSTNIQL